MFILPKEASVNTIKRILAVCDLMSVCDDFIRNALLATQGSRAEWYLLAIIDNPFGVRGLSFPRPSLEQDYQNLLQNTREGLRKIAAEVRQHGLSVQSMVREGKPLDQILNVIRDQNIDLLIMPAHEQSWMEGFLTGRINKRLLRELPCSILYIKQEPVAVEEEEDLEEDEEKAA
jgi:nucleotide-binding universal stress UspA family protein